MTETTTTTADAAANRAGPSLIDNRRSYMAFAFAFVFGHGAFAVSQGPDPLLDLPVWLPFLPLAAGIVPGVALSFIAAGRGQRGVGADQRESEKLVGTAWATGFIAVLLGITGLTTTYDVGAAEDVLWPLGAVFIVGMINIAEGAVRRNAVHYYLGSWLALIATGALFLTSPGPFWVLVVGGGGGYLVAAFAEARRLARIG